MWDVLRGIGIALILLLNFAISWFNAWAAGKAWPERRELAWPARIVLWSTALMSFVGFSWCYLFLIGFGLYKFHDSWSALSWMDATRFEQMQSLGYVILMPVLLVTGLVLTIDAWAAAWRRRQAADIGVAVYDTFAMIYNTAEAIQYLPGAFDKVGDLFSDNDRDLEDWVVVVIVAIVIAILFLGLFTTGAIIKASARSHGRHVVSRYASSGFGRRSRTTEG